MDLSKVRLVVTDMDGTLLNSKGEVSNTFFDLFKKFKENDIHFVAASGRQYNSITNKLNSIVDDITIIAENGGIAKQGTEELLVTNLPEESTNEIIELLRGIEDVFVVLCGKKSSYIETKDATFTKLFNEYYAAYEVVDDLTKVSKDDFVKIAVYHFESSEDHIYPSVKHLENNLQVKVSGKNWLDLSHPNANKGYALKMLQDRLGISKAETMVFGDYNNDLEMLALADFSFSMENAHPNVTKAANYQTKSNDENGVEYILDKLINAKMIDYQNSVFIDSWKKVGDRIEVIAYNINTKKKDAVTRCPDIKFNCKEILREKLKHFVSKDALNIEGFGKKVVENFWDKKLIKYPYDIFNLDLNVLKNLGGWGEKSINNLKNSINISKEISLERFIFSLGIRHIGEENAKVLAKYFLNINFFFKISKKLNDNNSKYLDELQSIDGIGNSQVESLKKFFSNNQNLKTTSKLVSILSIKNYKYLNKKTSISGKLIMFTGGFVDKSRSELKSLAEEMGAKIVSTISKKTDFLITGSQKPTTRKINEARNLNVKILNEDEWNKIIN